MEEQDHYITSSDGKRAFTYCKGFIRDRSGHDVPCILFKLLDSRVFHGKFEDLRFINHAAATRAEQAVFDYVYGLPACRDPATEADWQVLKSGELDLECQKGAKQVKPHHPPIVSLDWSGDYTQLKAIKVECSCGETVGVDLGEFNLHAVNLCQNDQAT